MNMSLNKYEFFNYIFYGLVVIVIVSEIFLQAIVPSDRVYYAQDVKKFPAGWVWVHDDGTREAVTVPGKFNVERKHTLVLETTLKDEINNTKYLNFRSSQQTVKAYINDVLRYEYKATDIINDNRNAASYNIVFPIYSDDQGKKLRLELTTDSPFTGEISTIYYGEEMDIWVKILSENKFEIGIAIFMASIAILSIVAGVVLKLHYQRGRMLECIGWVIMISVWIMCSESQIRQLFVSNVTVLSDMSYYLVLLLLLAIIRFINSSQKYNYTKAYLCIQIAIVFDAFVIYMLQRLGIMEYYTSFLLTLILAIVTLVTFVITAIKDMKLKRFYPYRNVFVSVIIFFTLSLLGHFLVNVLDVMKSIGIFFAVGLIFLFLAALSMTVKNIRDRNIENHKALYEKKAKDQFFAMISHEIRTPLNGVLGMNEMILRENKDANIEKYANSIKSSGSVLLSLINDVLDYTKIEAGKMDILDAPYNTGKMLCSDTETFQKQAATKNLSYEMKMVHGIPARLEGDEVRLRQIKTNLISNAIKYTESGKVVVSFDGRKKDDRFELIIKVKDTGKGIDKDDIEHLFESFKRVEDEKNHHIEGTGLGLAITKQLVELMHGKIEVKSEPGKGSEFIVTVPQKIIDKTLIESLDEDFDVISEEDSKDKNEIFKCPGTKILVVDDNEMNRTVMSLLLQQSECIVDVVCSGQEAVDISKDKYFDMILMDHVMPEMDGVEAMHRIREDDECINKDTIIIALTANAYTGIRDMYMGEGFTDYMAKPIEPEKLNEMLKQYIKNK